MYGLELSHRAHEARFLGLDAGKVQVYPLIFTREGLSQEARHSLLGLLGFKERQGASASSL